MKSESSAWGVLSSHLAEQWLAGAESEKSAQQIYVNSIHRDIVATVQIVVSEYAQEVALNILSESSKQKAPFWAKKWRGQR